MYHHYEGSPDSATLAVLAALVVYYDYASIQVPLS